MNAQNKEQVEGSKGGKTYLIVVALVLCAALAFYLFNASAKTTPTAAVIQQSANPSSGTETVRIPLSQISEKVSFLSQEVAGKTVKFMVVKGSDGQVRTAFDACEVCGGSRGYRQEGSDVVCNKCGKRFRIDDLGTKNAGRGCWPVSLPHTIEGDSVVILTGDLAGGGRFF